MLHVYNRYSDYLRQKYGCAVYKLPINLPVTCPNRMPPPIRRDELCSSTDAHSVPLQKGGGCSFCGEVGTGFEALPNTTPISEQLAAGAAKMRELYKAEKFIAYFQNFTNTYMSLDEFATYIEEAAVFPDLAEIAVSTRPDCIATPYLEILQNIGTRTERPLCVSIELGLQTANYHTLTKVNRGHSLAEFIDAVMQIKPYGFDICAHIILNLPWDNELDAVETAKIVSALGIQQVKLHALYILKNTPMAQQYLSGEISLISKEEYIDRAITFLEHLSPEIAVQRVIGRSPKNGSVFSNWGASWWAIHDAILDKMAKENRRQGRLCNYIGGAAVKHFL